MGPHGRAGQVGRPAERGGFRRRTEGRRAQDSLGVGGAVAGMHAVGRVDRLDQPRREVLAGHRTSPYASCRCCSSGPWPGPSGTTGPVVGDKRARVRRVVRAIGHCVSGRRRPQWPIGRRSRRSRRPAGRSCSRRRRSQRCDRRTTPPRVAERALLAGMRPLLVPSLSNDPDQKVIWRDQHACACGGGRAIAEHEGGVVYLAISVRNVGAGLALLHGWYPRPHFALSDVAHADVDAFRRLVVDLYVPPGGAGYWESALCGTSRSRCTASSFVCWPSGNLSPSSCCTATRRAASERSAGASCFRRAMAVGTARSPDTGASIAPTPGDRDGGLTARFVGTLTAGQGVIGGFDGGGIAMAEAFEDRDLSGATFWGVDLKVRGSATSTSRTRRSRARG